jgi:hypothetical protein
MEEIPMKDSHVTIRGTTARDDVTLSWLAALDSRRRIQGRALIAERGGVPIAAIGLTSGAVAADPFNRTADAVHMLRERRYRMLRQGGDTGYVGALLRRLTPQTA